MTKINVDEITRSTENDVDIHIVSPKYNIGDRVKLNTYSVSCPVGTIVACRAEIDVTITEHGTSSINLSGWSYDIDFGEQKFFFLGVYYGQRSAYITLIEKAKEN